MKKNNKLINEIKRLHEVMGIKGSLLNESIEPVLTKIAREISIDATRLEGKSLALRNAWLDLNNEALELTARGDALDVFISKAKTELPDLYKQISRIALDDKTIKATIDSTFTSNQKKVFSSNVEKMLRKGKTDNEVINAYKNTLDKANLSPLEKAALEQRMRDEVSTLRNLLGDEIPVPKVTTNEPIRVTTDEPLRVTTDEPTPKAGDEATDGGTPKVDNKLPNPEDVQKEIDSWANWDEIPDYTSKEIDELLYYNRLSKWLKDVFTLGETKLLNRVKRFNKLSKAYATSVERKVSTEVQSRLETEMIKELEVIMETSLKNRKESEIWIKNTIEGFEKTKKGVIIDPSERRFADWAKKVRNKDGTLKNPSEIRKLNIRESSSSDLVIGLKEAFAHWKKYPEFWNRIVRKKAPDTASKSNFLSWFGKGSRRGNPWHKWNRSNWDDVIDKSGLSAAKRQYIYELLFRYFQWNIIFGLGETFYQSIVSATADSDTREKIENCIKARALEDTDNTKENQVKQYCESIKTMEEIQLLHYLEDSIAVVLFKNMVYDWGDKDGGLLDTFTDLFPGKLDDVIIDGVIPYFAGTRNAKTVEEWQDMWGDAVDDVTEQAEEAEDALIDGAEENGIVLPTGDEGPTTSSSDGIPNSLDGLSTQFSYPKDQMSPQTYNGTGEIEIWGMKFIYNSTDKMFEQKQ